MANGRHIGEVQPAEPPWSSRRRSYRAILADVKTVVSIPDDLFEEADDLAHRLQVSRSELYATALRALLAADREVTARLDEVYRSAQPDPAMKAAARGTFSETAW